MTITKVFVCIKTRYHDMYYEGTPIDLQGFTGLKNYLNVQIQLHRRS